MQDSKFGLGPSQEVRKGFGNFVASYKGIVYLIVNSPQIQGGAAVPGSASSVLVLTAFQYRRSREDGSIPAQHLL